VLVKFTSVLSRPDAKGIVSSIGLLQAGITHVRTELKRVHQPLVAKGPAISSRRVVVDGSHHVQMLNNAESRAVTAIQVDNAESRAVTAIHMDKHYLKCTSTWVTLHN
jgi:hypothetical protein